MKKAAATIRDVARAADLSVASVSRALNGSGSMRPHTRERVIEAAQRLGYQPNAAARSLSTARTDAIGVVLPDLHGEFFSELVRGLDRAASERGYMLLLANMHADPALARKALSAMLGRVDGLIVMAPQISASDLAGSIPAGLPAILVNNAGPSQHPAIKVDNHAGIRAAVRLVVEEGCQNIVHFAAMPDNVDARERREAFVAAMAEFAPNMRVRIEQGDFTERSGYFLTEQLLQSGAAFDAIVAANDMMALGAQQALRAANIAVPAAVALTGFDDIPLARYLDLTTVRVEMVGLGERAVGRLLASLEKVNDFAEERIIPELIVRGSTARRATLQ